MTDDEPALRTLLTDRAEAGSGEIDASAVLADGRRYARRRRRTQLIATAAVLTAVVGAGAAVVGQRDGGPGRTSLATRNGPSANTTTNGRSPLPSFGPPSPGTLNATGGALLQGYLRGDDRCVWLGGPAGRQDQPSSLVWPYGWTYDPTTRGIYDPHGTLWAHVGDHVTGGGGTLPDGPAAYPPGDDCIVGNDGVGHNDGLFFDPSN